MHIYVFPCRASPDGYSLMVYRQGNWIYIFLTVFSIFLTVIAPSGNFCFPVVHAWYWRHISTVDARDKYLIYVIRYICICSLLLQAGVIQRDLEYWNLELLAPRFDLMCISLMLYLWWILLDSSLLGFVSLVVFGTKANLDFLYWHTFIVQHSKPHQLHIYLCSHSMYAK